MRFLASEPAGITELFGAGNKLFAACFPKLLGLVAVFAIAQIVFGILSQRLIEQIGYPFTDAVLQPANLFLLGLALLVYSLLNLVLYIGIVSRIDRVEQQCEDSMLDALVLGVRKLPAFFAANFLYVVANVLGLLLLVVPGVVLMLSLSLFPYFVVLESKGAYAGLKASHRLIRAHWWRATAFYTVPMLVLLVLAVLLSVFLAVFAGGHPFAANVAVQMFISVAVPYFFTLGYVLYHDLKLRRFGADADNRLAA